MWFRRCLIDHVGSKGFDRSCCEAVWPCVHCAEDWYFRRVMDKRIETSAAAMAKGKGKHKGDGKGKGKRKGQGGRPFKRNKGQKRKVWWAERQRQRAEAARGPRTPPHPPRGWGGRVPMTPPWGSPETPPGCGPQPPPSTPHDGPGIVIVETPGSGQYLSGG